MLHDIGWTNVPKKLQLPDNTKEENEKALHLHIEKAPPLIKNIMNDIGYSKREIEQVIDIAVAHKFTNPEDKSKQLLIDADTLSDTYKEAFYSDVKSYNCTPLDTYNFRSKNKFYTKTAKRIFKKCLKNRLSEIKSKKKKFLTRNSTYGGCIYNC